ncbi:fertility inhibition protein FinO [Edwardsiella anguillarum]|uniref:Fertility inhibition protein n=1 Tax=Edwardsiella anguillarum TaxID=1821960 RepID=A0ABY8SJI4_9GAMM|nr:fertility inhibition protein FinO [Edwardsiella anguillarum]WHP85879.1 fertility inhibition protein FinO [Edwardsiella anguillarum]WHP89716.1 fertility inhibition protein FinO [Edwardsiella anguillarum]WHP93515.1 fertility inhibition protein FinO [Edwardsiella anguillarum]WHP97354.1 fertility inhibition protein FinO [Edwardsiella anguillarum]WHQ01118.1 fertility inhibition protein FinO [Edwardsiella anguillarum]
MNTEKRPTLSLKRKRPVEETPAAAADAAPVVVRRKKVVVVNTPPPWKVKKQKLAAQKQAEEAKRAPTKVPSVTPPPTTPARLDKKCPPKPPKGVVLMPLAEAVALMKPHWPGLFEGDTPRLLQIGLRDALLADIATRALPLSRKQLRRCLKRITRSTTYLRSMVVGASRYGIDGQPVATITEEEQQYACARMESYQRRKSTSANRI